MLSQTDLIVNYSLQLIWISIQLLVAIFLLVKMIKTKTYNYIPLILFFFIGCLRIFSLFPSLLLIFLFLVQFPNILLVVFTKLTFFKYKKSPFKIFLISLIIVRSIDFIIRLNFRISIPMTYSLDESNLIYYYYILISITISFLLSHLWFGIVAVKYYKSIKSVDIVPWIKKRYQIIGIGSLIYTLSLFVYYFIPYNINGASTFPNNIYGFILLGFTICYSLFSFFGWVMPRFLKNFFNKNFEHEIQKEYSENELMDIIDKRFNEDNS